MSLIIHFKIVLWLAPLNVSIRDIYTKLWSLILIIELLKKKIALCLYFFFPWKFIFVVCIMSIHCSSSLIAPCKSRPRVANCYWSLVDYYLNQLDIMPIPISPQSKHMVCLHDCDPPFFHLKLTFYKIWCTIDGR